jgi:hypothetical protein
MPCIIKQKTSNSPGVIVFTHAEALWGVPRRSKAAREFISNSTTSGSWLFGIHVQGDCSHISEWPLEDWHSFIMWPEAEASFLKNVPRDKILPLSCMHFMPNSLSDHKATQKNYDLCIVSRASSIKRIHETLLVVRSVLNKISNLKVIFIVPDPRDQQMGYKCYKKQRIDRSYFDLPRKIFSSNEFKNISFISSSQISFGNFPLSQDIMSSLISESRFLMLLSHSEGTPRVFSESLMLGTPCIVSESLRSGIGSVLSDKNSVKISDNIETGADQIVEALLNYDKFQVDRNYASKVFNEVNNLTFFQDFISRKILDAGHLVEGDWYLNDLHLRLASHGQKHNQQFIFRDGLFFDWLSRVQSPECAHIYNDDNFADSFIDDLPLAKDILKEKSFIIFAKFAKMLGINKILKIDVLLNIKTYIENFFRISN